MLPHNAQDETESMLSPTVGNSFNRLHSPNVTNNVLRPIEQKIREYDVLMHQADQQRMHLDEEIRLMQERRSLAEEQFMAAKAKHEEYERQHTGVGRVLRGEPEPEIYSHSVPRVENFDNQASIQTMPLAPSNLGHLEPSNYFTRHQMFYIFVMDGIGGMAISGGVNFALAYAMYTTQNTVKSPIRLFQLPNTLAGDAAVTIIIQCILTWFVEKVLVAHDLARRGVQPIGFVSKPHRPWVRWLFFLPPLGYDEAIDEEAKYETQPQTAAASSPATILASFLQEALRGFLIAVVGFFLLWPAGVGILTAFGKRTGNDYTYADRWTPQIFKGILGGVLGLLTTPLMAIFWLIKAGWENELHRGREP